MKLQSLKNEYHIGQYLRRSYFYKVVNKMNLNESRILDVGCGYGSYLLCIAEMFPTAELVGFDYNKPGIEATLKTILSQGKNNIEVFTHDARAAFEMGEFDFIYSIDVLEHIEEDRQVLKNIHQALKPKGRFLMHVPLENRRFPLKRLFGFDYSEPHDHIRDGYAEDDLEEKIRSTGFNVNSKLYTFGPWGTIAWEIMRIFEDRGNHIRSLTNLASKALCLVELGFEHKKGNGILIIAEKSLATSEDS